MYKTTVKNVTGRTTTKTFEVGHDATSFVGGKFRTDKVQAVSVVKDPRGTTTTVLFFDKAVARSEWIFPIKQN